MEEFGPFRHYETGQAMRISVDGPTIRAVEPFAGPLSGEIPWVSPGFWDLQVNGRRGISFSDPGLIEEDVGRIVREHARSGVSHVFPTLITAPPEAMLHGVRTLAGACKRSGDVDALIGGIHLEGPWISPVDGYRGAHPIASVRDPDLAEFVRLQDAAGGRIAIITLAPERPGAIDLIRDLTALGITVALGHTAADGPTISEAVAAGARLSTHLGNGIASPLERHPNPIWNQAADDRLMASLIVDGEHLDDAIVKVLARAKGTGRIVLVSDLSPLAGLPAGRYGEWEVASGGKVVVSGTDYLAGSTVELPEAMYRLMWATGWGMAEVIATVTTNPARLLGRRPPRIAEGESADLAVFGVGERGEVGPVRPLAQG